MILVIWLFFSIIIRGLICHFPFFVMSFFVKVPKKLKWGGICVIALIMALFFTAKFQAFTSEFCLKFALDIFTTFIGVFTLQGLGITLHNTRLCNFCKKYRKL